MWTDWQVHFWTEPRVFQITELDDDDKDLPVNATVGKGKGKKGKRKKKQEERRQHLEALHNVGRLKLKDQELEDRARTPRTSSNKMTSEQQTPNSGQSPTDSDLAYYGRDPRFWSRDTTPTSNRGVYLGSMTEQDVQQVLEDTREWEEQRRLESSEVGLFMPTLETDDESTLEAWHTMARLPDGQEGLLVDPGAHDSLTGDAFVRRMTKILRDEGYPTVSWSKLPRPIGVQGVGHGSQKCEWKACVPLALQEGASGDFTAPVVPNSEIPPLLGLATLRRLRAIVDTFQNKLYLCGPGDVEILLPPGSSEFDLKDAPSGHMLLPVTEFKQQSDEQASAIRKHLFVHRSVVGIGKTTLGGSSSA